MRYFLLFLLCVGMLLPSQLQAQYLPDTTLSFTQFLRECQDFSRGDQQEVWVVTFWASYNTASLYELSDLKSLSKLYQSKAVRFVGISVDKNRTAWEQALLRYELDWEHMFLPNQDQYNFLRRAFKHRSFPATFLVYTDGRIRRVQDFDELKFELAREAASLPTQDFFSSTDTDEISIDRDDPFADTRDEFSSSEDEVEDEFILYTIRKGDTLFSLYKKFGVSVAEIKQINGMKSDRIRAGDQIRLPRP
ncbi:MAG: LysM peptidoglycan-binding domain-containing protein [Bacteroidota bacterium]